MSAIPPKHTPDEAPGKKPEEVGGSLAMYQAAQSDATSFPVLQAFQQFIDQERAQARKKMFQLSLAFGILIVAVVAVFLAVGIAMMHNMSSMQTKLLDAALAKQPQPVAQPVVVQSAAPAAVPPELSASLQQVAQAANALQSAAQKDEAQKSAARDEELKKMREEMEKMRAEAAAAKAAAETAAKAAAKPRPPAAAAPGVSPAVAAALAAAKATEAAKAAELAKAAAAAPKVLPLANAPAAAPAPAVAPAPAAAPAVAAANTPAAVNPPAAAPAAPAPNAPAAADKANAPAAVSPAVAEALATAKAAEKAKEAEAVQEGDPRLPPATKDPPVCDANIKRPDAPAGMMSTAIPLKTKRSGTIPWRAMIPE